MQSCKSPNDESSSDMTITVQFLDDTSQAFQLKKRKKGSQLLNKVFQHLDLTDRDYFGIQLLTDNPQDVIVWLDPNKKLYKQTIRKGCLNSQFQFRVKFYVSDPTQLEDERTRYQYFLQIKRDIYQGRLTCPVYTLCLLASYIVQIEFGDFISFEKTIGHLSSIKLIDERTKEIEYRISELHKLHKGQLPDDAEYNYIEHARKLPLYGIFSYRTIDSDDEDLCLGVSSMGLSTFQEDVILSQYTWSNIVKISFKRKNFLIQLRREKTESLEITLTFNMGSRDNAKAVWRACVEHHSFFRLEQSMDAPHYWALCFRSRFQYTGRTELQIREDNRRRANGLSKMFRRPVDATTTTITATTTTTATTTITKQSPNKNGGGGGNGNSENGKNALSILTITKTYKSYDNKVTSKHLDTQPRKAWEQQSRDSNEMLDASEVDAKDSHDLPSDIHPNAPYDRDKSPTYGRNDDNLMIVRLLADDQGRFGFNVRGGLDFDHPVLVSRVAPYTPADMTIPKIKEGDQVLYINGQDVSGLKHNQVISLIKTVSEFHSDGELILTLRPNANSNVTEEEPVYRYVPDATFDHPQLVGDAVFSQSLLLLNDGLASGLLLEQYEQLYRRNMYLTIDEAKRAENLNKNRYRDIAPYDCNRVIVANANDTGYINANYINMEIPNDCVNRYIATQGPLANTVVDFWRMVQQESSNLVVMLTTVIERGRIKCHQYWPDENEQMELTPTFTIICLKEEIDSSDSFIFRDFLLCDSVTKERRHIQHMQYLAWPDHGVPSDPELFLQFTEKVRDARKTTLLQEIDQSLKQLQLNDVDGSDSSMERPVIKKDCIKRNDKPDSPLYTSAHQFISAANPPIIVHCSAGIGRTGMLILMDTALSLMLVKEPVYPLDIVKIMRDQRACMIQNVAQYRFICECICAAYSKLVRDSLSSI